MHNRPLQVETLAKVRNHQSHKRNFGRKPCAFHFALLILKKKKKRKDIKLGKTIKQAKNHRTQKNLTNSSVLPYE